MAVRIPSTRPASLPAAMLLTLACSTTLANDWVYCAAEGGTCHVPGPAIVRYGADGEHVHREVRGTIACTNRAFGDPAYGAQKICEYRRTRPGGRRDSPPPGLSGAAIEPGWRLCALENDACSFQGTAEVRFGADGRYMSRVAQGGIPCETGVFGDPAYGVRKHCLVRESGPFSHGAGGWQACALEGDTCNAPSGAAVRFGAQGRYALMPQVTGPVPCSTDVFGDPAWGERKRCEVKLRP